MLYRCIEMGSLQFVTTVYEHLFSLAIGQPITNGHRHIQISHICAATFLRTNLIPWYHVVLLDSLRRAGNVVELKQWPSPTQVPSDP